MENIINDQFVLGIDIGGSKIRLGLVDVNGEVVWSITKPNFNFDTISQWIEYFKNQILNQIPPKLIYSFSKIGIGAAGWIDQNTHIIIHSPNTNWTNINLKMLLENELNIPITIINDCTAAVIGEHTYGAINKCTNALGIFIGTGVGGGLILNNNIYEGSDGFAGEIGHTIIIENGNLCECGKRGCLEAYTGGKAIGKIAEILALKDKQTSLIKFSANTNNVISAETVSMAFYNNDKVAIKIVKDTSNKLATAISNFSNIFDPDGIVIGGGVIDGIPEIVQYIEDSYKNKSITKNPEGKIRKSKLGKDMVVIGAATVARRSFKTK